MSRPTLRLARGHDATEFAANSTESFVCILSDGMSRQAAARFRDLLIELDSPKTYITAIDPATAFQRMKRDRDRAIVEAFAFYQAGSSRADRARELEKSWARYLAGDWKRGGRPEFSKRYAAIHRLCVITGGAEPVSAYHIERIVRDWNPSSD
jgi:hypothetical protein